MKKFILFIIFMCVVSSPMAFAEGEYDGVWMAPVGFISMHENNGVIVALELRPDATRWFIYAGELEGNEVRVTSVPLTAEDPVVVLDVVFQSDTFATATGVSCEPIELCAEFGALVQQLGGGFEAKKIW